ncbi:hypothetical protein GE278_00740 [Enterobacteriaceae bacterium Kacie_13]|nr:hypothetical protein GE278_00740 [Enterobacteriaceae bacterium Kacie_13]
MPYKGESWNTLLAPVLKLFHWGVSFASNLVPAATLPVYRDELTRLLIEASHQGVPAGLPCTFEHTTFYRAQSYRCAPSQASSPAYSRKNAVVYYKQLKPIGCSSHHLF